jgi:hypothetical protein
MVRSESSWNAQAMPSKAYPSISRHSSISLPKGRRRQMGRASPTHSVRLEADRSRDIHKATRVNQQIEMQIRNQDMGALKTFAAAVLFTFSTILYARAEPDLCEREMTQAAKKYDIPLGILFAVGLTETGIGGICMPTPSICRAIPFTPSISSKRCKDFKLPKLPA